MRTHLAILVAVREKDGRKDKNWTSFIKKGPLAGYSCPVAFAESDLACAQGRRAAGVARARQGKPRFSLADAKKTQDVFSSHRGVIPCWRILNEITPYIQAIFWG
jgi:hypothetical protein